MLVHYGPKLMVSMRIGRKRSWIWVLLFWLLCAVRPVRADIIAQFEPAQVAVYSGTFFTNVLTLTSWNNAAGAFSTVVQYDTNVVKIEEITVPPSSPFLSDTFVDTLSFASGQTRVVAFQAAITASNPTSYPIATIRWKSVGPTTTASVITIKLEGLVDARWMPTEAWSISGSIQVKTDTDRKGNILAGVCADYDGDGKADPAIYDETTGTWKVKLSSANYYLVITTLNGLGGPGYASVTADYDGDGKADPAVYHELTGRWIILPSSANYEVAIIMSQPLGGIGYSGMPADYDGDKLADPGVYQHEQGDWKVLLSSANYYSVELLGLLGGTGYRAVAADYDGDMMTDPAIYGEDTGIWAVMLSSANYWTFVMPTSLGGTGYLPVPADYDGDGLADPAIKSESGNEWIVMFSSGGYTPVPLTIMFE